MSERPVSILVLAARALAKMADKKPPQDPISDFASERSDDGTAEGEESHDGDPPPA